MEQERNDGGNREEACNTLGGLICVECSFSDRSYTWNVFPSHGVRWHMISRGVRWHVIVCSVRWQVISRGVRWHAISRSARQREMSTNPTKRKFSSNFAIILVSMELKLGSPLCLIFLERRAKFHGQRQSGCWVVGDHVLVCREMSTNTTKQKCFSNFAIILVSMELKLGSPLCLI